MSIRLTDSEKSAICKKSKKAHLTLTEYILKSSLQSEIKVTSLAFKRRHICKMNVVEIDNTSYCVQDIFPIADEQKHNTVSDKIKYLVSGEKPE